MQLLAQNLLRISTVARSLQQCSPRCCNACVQHRAALYSPLVHNVSAATGAQAHSRQAYRLLHVLYEVHTPVLLPRQVLPSGSYTQQCSSQAAMCSIRLQS